jgi:carbohydrate-selective porin OprB
MTVVSVRPTSWRLSLFRNATIVDLRGVTDAQVAGGLAYGGPFRSRPEDDTGIAGAMRENRNALVFGSKTLAISEPLAAPASLRVAITLLYNS